ncbi:MAG: pentapeptide repeat-containing protein [Symploca sp. SIO2C1]|nr:pentapeptide repeat-containing protein [Symploca sp. SIO2C1]
MTKAKFSLATLGHFLQLSLKKCPVPIAIGLSLIVIVATAFLEPTYLGENSNKDNQEKTQCTDSNSLNYIICKITNSKFLDQVQNLSVIIAAFLYLMGAGERKKQSERQAWQLIDGARDAETSGARIQALEELNEEGISLRGLDADGADLIEINLPNADLERTNLKDALLIGANLQRANLYKAKLQSAKLQGANLEEAELWGANLEGANLQVREPEMTFNGRTRTTEKITNLQKARLGRANLNNAILEQANLKGADLRGAFMRGADLRETDLTDADIFEAKFRGVRYLDLDQVKLAKNWEKAKYDRTFCLKYSQYNLLADEGNVTENTDSRQEKSVEIKLLKLMEKLLATKEREKRKEIATISQKIDELIKILDSDSSVSLLGNPLVEEDLTNAAENLIAVDELAGDSHTSQAAEMREKVANFQKTVRKQNEAYEGATKREQEADMLAKLYLIAGEWLFSNYKLIRREGVSYYLDNNQHTQVADEQLDSDEKRMQLETDIDEVLLHIATCLVKPEYPHFTGVNFNLPFPIQSEVLQIICNNIITKIANRQSDVLTDKGREKLDSFLKSAIATLQKRRD